MENTNINLGQLAQWPDEKSSKKLTPEDMSTKELIEQLVEQPSMSNEFFIIILKRLDPDIRKVIRNHNLSEQDQEDVWAQVWLELGPRQMKCPTFGKQ
jgi:hypothetical protein